MLRGLSTQVSADQHNRDSVARRLATLEHFCLRHSQDGVPAFSSGTKSTIMVPYVAVLPTKEAATVTDVVKGLTDALSVRLDEVELRLARLQTETATEVLYPCTQ